MESYSIDIIVSGNGKQYKSNITLKANSLEEIFEQVKNIKTLNNLVEHSDLQTTVELIKNKPRLIPEIKKIIDELKDKSKGDALMSAGKYISRIMSILRED